MSLQPFANDCSELLKIICRALDEKKAADIRVLKVAEISTVTDFFVIASGQSIPQLKAMCKAVEKALKAHGTPILGIDNDAQSGWMVVDGFEFIVHIFLPEIRDTYGLDVIWKDAEVLPTSAFL